MKNKIEKLINYFDINLKDRKASTEKDKDKLLLYLKENFNVYEEQRTNPFSVIYGKFKLIDKHLSKNLNIKINNLEEIFLNYTLTSPKAEDISIKEIRKMDYFFAREDTTNASNQKMVKSGILASLLMFYENDFQSKTRIKFIDPLSGTISTLKTKDSVYKYLLPCNSNNRLYGCKLFSHIIGETSYIVFDELIYKNYDDYIFEFLSKYNILLEKLEKYHKTIFEITTNKEFKVQLIVNENYENQEFLKIELIDEIYIESKLPIKVVINKNPLLTKIKLLFLTFKKSMWL